MIGFCCCCRCSTYCRTHSRREAARNCNWLLVQPTCTRGGGGHGRHCRHCALEELFYRLNNATTAEGYLVASGLTLLIWCVLSFFFFLILCLWPGHSTARCVVDETTTFAVRVLGWSATALNEFVFHSTLAVLLWLHLPPSSASTTTASFYPSISSNYWHI